MNIDLKEEFSENANQVERAFPSKFSNIRIEKGVRMTEKSILDGEMNDPYNGSFTDGTISLPLWD
ncbi:MAG: hypothetical protein JSU59_10865 [Nitrospirota bacterium]|nr:MAG: hypothetical protein JSU59_10865 [Nitrospirota bacterium]